MCANLPQRAAHKFFGVTYFIGPSDDSAGTGDSLSKDGHVYCMVTATPTG